ncbi:Leucine-, glutamate- and lysine-rich protein 1 [Trifolium repens]|nr:Leucine-, glutamate- and lysine-rich protein 1 [Trifolium repens]
MITNGKIIMDLNCFLKFEFILVIIILLLGFLAWLENKVKNSNNKREEVVQVSDEINQLFEQDHEDNIISNGLSEYCVCSFCSKLSNIITRCSRCKNYTYCSKVCHVMHWRYCEHRDECDEVMSTEDHEESSFHGAQCFLLEPRNETSNYSFNDDDKQNTYEGDIYYIEGGEDSDESIKETTRGLIQYDGIVSNYNDNNCAVCGNPCSKKCSRCKAIKYCSQTCQHFDWKSGHKFQCCVKMKSSTQIATSNQEWPAGEIVAMPPILDEVADTDHSNDPLCLEFHSEENTMALILSSQEANNKVEEVEEKMRNLKEELEMIRNENITLQSKLNYWELRAKYSAEKLYSFKKENEHQLFILKHELESTSNAEKQARQMVTNLSQKIHCLQNECTKTKREFQEQNKYVERLRQKLDDATQFPMRIDEETRQKLAITSNAIFANEFKPAFEVSKTISLSRNPTLTSQCCTICLSSEKDLAFGCGHMTCRECGSKIRKCHICRKKIVNRITLYPG